MLTKLLTAVRGDPSRPSRDEIEPAALELVRRHGAQIMATAHVVAFARRCGVRRLALFHHDPLHDDPMLREMTQEAQAAADGAVEEVSAAREGDAVEVRG